MLKLSFIPSNLHSCWARDRKRSIVSFTVTGGNKAGFDLVLIQPVRSYADYYLSNIISIRKGRRFISKQGQPQPHIHSMARITVKWSTGVIMEHCSHFLVQWMSKKRAHGTWAFWPTYWPHKSYNYIGYHILVYISEKITHSFWWLNYWR